ncbi:MAG: Uma2 family endonuclease [Leptolyngbyaceae cyanobacterium CSU_1_4]|nr:Uma2 family endonuclease [Leptolyngbyaceae cyanobacterium CSU_1_4]
MASLLPLPQTAISQRAEVVYPSLDGEPLAETSVHIDAIIHSVVALRNYVEGQQAIVLADQFLYYVQGFPKFWVAPDVMVIFNVPPGARDNYRVWEEAQVPSVIFEMTSAGTKERDEIVKKDLYESLEVAEYWQFDPKGEWIAEKLRGYRLGEGVYVPITDGRSEPLHLRLEVDGALIAFFREDTGEKLLAAEELVQALRQETLARQEAEALLEQERTRAEQERARANQEQQQAEQERQRGDRLAARLRELGEDPDLM